MATAATSFEGVIAGLRQDGYVVIEGVLTEEEVAEARAALAPLLAATPTGRNSFEGFRTRRVYSILAKTRVLDRVVLNPLVLGICDQLLREYLLSATVGIEIGSGEAAQAVHHDDAVYPMPRPHDEVLVSTMWALDDFVPENGATVMYPGSHRATGAWRAEDHRPTYAMMGRGSVAIYLGTLWHNGGANRTDRPRLGVTFEYVAGWLRQQENQTLAVPPGSASALPERLRELLGYSVYPPFMGYVDGRHPKRLIEGGTSSP